MTRLAVAVVVAIAVALGAAAACGGGRGPRPSSPAAAAPATPADQILALLPQGAQLVVELDLARIRSNEVVGPVIRRVLTGGLALPGALPASPLATADRMVLAAYGVGTEQAAMLTVVASRVPVADATVLDVVAITGTSDTGTPSGTSNSSKSGPPAEGAGSTPAGAPDGPLKLYALGPTEWVAQLEARAAIAAREAGLRAEGELLALRDHAMPAGAPGASLRVTARLPFDARVALARQTGLESAPAQLSIWADVVEDFAMVVDAEASDPGEKSPDRARARLEALVRGALASLAGEPTARALGLPSSLMGAKLVARGTWVRAIIAIGPAHLKRVVERAAALLPGDRPSS